MKRTLMFVVPVALYFAVSLLWIGGDRRIARHAYDEFSASNTGPKGVSLASRYLARSGRGVGTLTLALNGRNVAPGAVVFRLQPSPFARFRVDNEELEDEKKGKKKVKTHYVTPLLNDEEEAWVRAGGRLVIGAGARYGSLDVADAPAKVAHKVFPLWPGLETLDLPASRAVSGEALRNGHAVYVADDKAVVARVADGAGDVIVFGAPEALDNEQLSKNLPFLLALAGGARRVYFDETIHGMSTGEGALGLMKEWRLGPFLLLLLILAAAVVWRGGTRVGVPDDEYRDTRSDAIDLVGSLGALYERSMTKSQALAAYQRELTRAVAASTGLRGDALHKRIAELTGGFDAPPAQITDEEFLRGLGVLNAAYRKC